MAFVRHIERFSISGTPTNNSEVLDTAVSKKGRRWWTHAIAERYVFHANTTNQYIGKCERKIKT